MTYFSHLDPQRIIPILEAYKAEHGEYPTTPAIGKLKRKHPTILPSPRWIQTHGGIIPFYHSLGLHYTDARTGARRANVANNANRKSQSNDVMFAQRLVETYGEPNVHWQAPYNKGVSLHRSDFKVFTPSGRFFFIDLFFPQDIESLQGCVNLKLKKLSKIPIEKNAEIFFICCNEDEVSDFQVERYVKSRKTPLPRNVTLMHIIDAPVILGLV